MWTQVIWNNFTNKCLNKVDFLDVIFEFQINSCTNLTIKSLSSPKAAKTTRNDCGDGFLFGDGEVGLNSGYCYDGYGGGVHGDGILKQEVCIW